MKDSAGPDDWQVAVSQPDRLGESPFWQPHERLLYWVDIPAMQLRRLLQLSPAGELLRQTQVPALCPTMPCFGGDDLRTLYLTSARDKRPAAELERLPGSGCVLSMRVELEGLPVNFFID